MIKTAAQILAEVGPEPKRRIGRPLKNRICDLPHCTGKHKIGGLCQPHWYAKNRWGDPYHVWVRPKKGALNLRCGCPTHEVTR